MTLVTNVYDEEDKIWGTAAANRPLYDFDCSVGKIIFHQLKNFGDNVVQISGQISEPDGVELTQRELLRCAMSVMQHLCHDWQLTHEDVVAISASNSTNVLAVEVACLFNCTPFHAVNPALAESELRHIFSLTRPKVIFCDGGAVEKLRAATSDFRPVFCTFTDHVEGVAHVEELFGKILPPVVAFQPVDLVKGGGQTMAILCSSGTSGMPKAVCVSNHRLVSEMGFLTNEDVIFSYSSLDWNSGLMTSLLPCLQGCKRIISRSTFSPQHFVDMVSKHAVTLTLLAPFHLYELTHWPEASDVVGRLRSLRFLAVIGSATSQSGLRRLKELLPHVYIRLSYGLTEVGGVAGHILPPGMAVDLDTSAGKLLAGVRARVISEEGANLPVNEMGEILVNNGLPWNGYYGNAEATAETQDGDGWFHTGDLGYFDEHSILHIKDRKRDTLKYRGFHYWPTEWENVIEEGLAQDVIAACVLGVEDEQCGDAPCAVVVKRPHSNLTVQDVNDCVAKRFGGKRLEGGVYFVGELPYGRNGKKLRREVKRWVLAQMPNGEAESDSVNTHL